VLHKKAFKWERVICLEHFEYSLQLKAGTWVQQHGDCTYETKGNN
jgi:hypothetical protein